MRNRNNTNKAALNMNCVCFTYSRGINCLLLATSFRKILKNNSSFSRYTFLNFLANLFKKVYKQAIFTLKSSLERTSTIDCCSFCSMNVNNYSPIKSCVYGVFVNIAVTNPLMNYSSSPQILSFYRVFNRHVFRYSNCN